MAKVIENVLPLSRWWAVLESNQRPLLCERSVLTAELTALGPDTGTKSANGWLRTNDLALMKRPLYP